MTRGFDAVLVIGFGGPGGMDQVRPFLENVVRGRRVPAARLDEVAKQYALFEGVSPITEITQRQAAGLEAKLSEWGLGLPVFVGMRNWHPFLADTLCAMADRGIRRAIGVIAAAHRSYSSCGQYKENVAAARGELRRRADVEILYVDDWYDHPKFIATHAANVEAALKKLDSSEAATARIVFTAHSIPEPMAAACRYREQLTETARLIAQALGREDWVLVYQSRSGRPMDPWLEPDVGDYLRAERAKGLRAVVISPIGFVCDHIEVLYDLDRKAADVCADLHLPMVRAATPNDDPRFIEAWAHMVRQVYERGQHSLPLEIVGMG